MNKLLMLIIITLIISTVGLWYKIMEPKTPTMITCDNVGDLRFVTLVVDNDRFQVFHSDLNGKHEDISDIYNIVSSGEVRRSWIVVAVTKLDTGQVMVNNYNFNKDQMTLSLTTLSKHQGTFERHERSGQCKLGSPMT